MASKSNPNGAVVVTRSDWQLAVDARLDALEQAFTLALAPAGTPAPAKGKAAKAAPKGKAAKVKPMGKATRIATRVAAGAPANARYLCGCGGWGATPEFAAKHASKGHTVTDTMAK